MKNHSSPGFTLIEVMIVAAIIAILAAVAYPSYLTQVRKTKRAECRAALTQVMQQQERFYSQNSTYITFSYASTNADEQKFKWFSGDSSAASACEITATATCINPTNTDLKNCVLLTARPGTAQVNVGHQDTECQSLTYDSRGQKSVVASPAGVAPTATAAVCWK